MSRNNSDNGPIDLTSSQETQHNEQVQAQQAWQNANVKYHQQSMMMSEGNSEVPNDCQQQQSECGVGPYYTTQCQNQMNQIQHPQNYCQNQCHLPIQNPHMNSFISPQTDTSQPLRLPCAQFCIIGPYQSCEQLIEHQTQLQWNGVSNATTGTSHCSEYQQASLQSHSECQSRINDQHDIEDITSGCAARNKRASVKQTREPQSTTKKRFRIPIHQKLKVSNSNTASTVTVTSSQQVPIKIQQTEQSKVQPKNPWVKKKISPAEVVTSNSPPYYGRNLILDNHQQQYPNSDFKFSKYHRNRENFFFQGLSQEAQIQYQKFQRNQQQEIEFEPSVASDSLPDHSEVPAKASISDSNWKSRTLQDSVKIFNKSLLSLKDKFGKQRSSQSTGSASTMMSPNKVESSENISTTNLSTAVDCNTLSTTLSQSDSPGDGPSQESFSVYQSEESHSITNSGPTDSPTPTTVTGSGNESSTSANEASETNPTNQTVTTPMTAVDTEVPDWMSTFVGTTGTAAQSEELAVPALPEEAEKATSALEAMVEKEKKEKELKAQAEAQQAQQQASLQAQQTQQQSVINLPSLLESSPTATGETPAGSIGSSGFAKWFEDQKKQNKIVSSACRKVIEIPQSCVGLILGKQGKTVIELRKRNDCWININQERSKETGYSECTITAEKDEKIQKCESEIAQLIDDFQNGRNFTGQNAGMNKVGGNSNNNNNFMQQLSDTLGNNGSNMNNSNNNSNTSMINNSNLAAQAAANSDVTVDKVEIPLSFVGLIIGSNGKTINKVKRHTNTDIFMLQQTIPNPLYKDPQSPDYDPSIHNSDTTNPKTIDKKYAQISGQSPESVMKAKEVLAKMIESGRLSAEGYAEYEKAVREGVIAPGQPFKIEKLPGLEFLDEEEDGTPSSSPVFNGNNNNNGNGGNGNGPNGPSFRSSSSSSTSNGAGGGGHGNCFQPGFPNAGFGPSGKSNNGGKKNSQNGNNNNYSNNSFGAFGTFPDKGQGGNNMGKGGNNNMNNKGNNNKGGFNNNNNGNMNNFNKNQNLSANAQAFGQIVRNGPGPQAVQNQNGQNGPITGSSGAMYTFVDCFEVPKKYLGLYIGKKGDNIKRFREQANNMGIEIQVDQESNDQAGTVRVLGNNKDDLLKLKFDMVNNLMRAITNSESHQNNGNNHFNNHNNNNNYGNNNMNNINFNNNFGNNNNMNMNNQFNNQNNQMNNNNFGNNMGGSFDRTNSQGSSNSMGNNNNANNAFGDLQTFFNGGGNNNNNGSGSASGSDWLTDLFGGSGNNNNQNNMGNMNNGNMMNMNQNNIMNGMNNMNNNGMNMNNNSMNNMNQNNGGNKNNNNNNSWDWSPGSTSASSMNGGTPGNAQDLIQQLLWSGGN